MSKIFTNTSGTTAKSYQFGKDGLKVYTQAAVDTQSEKVLNRYLKVNDPLSTENDETIAYISSIVVQSCTINGNNTVTFTLNTGESFTVSSALNSDSVHGPSASNIGNVAVFDSTDGKSIADSNSCITNKIENIDNIAAALNDSNGSVRSEIAENVKNSTDLPTAMAVIDYVGTLSEALQRRLNGTL